MYIYILLLLNFVSGSLNSSCLCSKYLTESERSADKSICSSASKNGSKCWYRYSTTVGCTRRFTCVYL